MAEKAVTFVLDNLLPLLEKELKLSKEVREEVPYIKDELERMRAFLRVADATEEIDENTKIRIKQVRDVAYDTEDVLEELMLHLVDHHQQDDGDGCLNFLCEMVRWIMNVGLRHQVASTIKDVKKRVQDISEGSQRYLLKSLEQGSTSTSSTKSSTWHDSRGDALLIDEAELVGIEKPKKELIGLLMESGPESELGIVSVVGMGGLGKTTLVKKVYDDLVKKVYDDQQVKKYFECHAWITVSQSFGVEELLKDMIQQLFGESKQPVPQGLDTKTEAGLKDIIKECLQLKRYVIVFDDIWSIGAWNALKYALPNTNCGSRIMVTTRFNDIAFSCKKSFGIGHVYKLKPLGRKASRTLFCMKVFRENTCPLHLKDLAWRILQRCGGLPLAIVAIGGLLATKDNTKGDEWDIVYRSLPIELNKNENLKSVKRVLSLSYNDLPYYLKPCFLYLSIIPKDHLIKPTRLIRLWVAEGFIEEEEGKTMEEVGEDYLNQLINRSLIQIAEKTIDGRIRRCRVHDLVREIILSKSKDQNFGTINVESETSHHERIRRLSIHKSCGHIPSTMSFIHLRSLIMIIEVGTLCNTKFFSSFRLLKVLDLRGVPFETFPGGLIDLFHLRYLCLRSTKIRMLPDSIEKLRNLETLDLKHSYVSELPIGIIKLQKLRHLLLYRYNIESYATFEDTQGIKIEREIGGLVALQKLCFIEANNQCNNGTSFIRGLGRLSQLRRLGIRKLRREDGKDLCHSIENMNNLRSLSVGSTEEKEALELENLSSPPPYLQRLYMRGRLERLPQWIPLLHYLTKISLRWSNLRHDPLEALQVLPDLVELELLQAYDGESLCFKTGGFQRLKVLSLDKLDRLRWVRMEMGTMPHLQKLSIKRCGSLSRLPVGIELLENIKELWFYDMPADFLTTLLPDKGEDHSKISGIPKIYFFFWMDGGWKHCYL